MSTHTTTKVKQLAINDQVAVDGETWTVVELGDEKGGMRYAKPCSTGLPNGGVEYIPAPAKVKEVA